MAEKDVAEDLEKNAQNPRRASGDIGSVEQHSLEEQIAAARYLAARKRRSHPHRALRLAKLSHGGTA